MGRQGAGAQTPVAKVDLDLMWHSFPLPTKNAKAAVVEMQWLSRENVQESNAAAIATILCYLAVLCFPPSAYATCPDRAQNLATPCTLLLSLQPALLNF